MCERCLLNSDVNYNNAQAVLALANATKIFADYGFARNAEQTAEAARYITEVPQEQKTENASATAFASDNTEGQVGQTNESDIDLRNAEKEIAEFLAAFFSGRVQKQ